MKIAGLRAVRATFAGEWTATGMIRCNNKDSLWMEKVLGLLRSAAFSDDLCT